MRAIVYTDGGSRPNPGATGYGYTGFIYKLDEVGKGTSKKPGTHTLTDKGFLKNDEVKKHKALKVSPIFYLNGWGSVLQGTNNQGELLGVIKTLDTLLSEPELTLQNIHLKIDSKYVIGWVVKLLGGNYKLGIDVKNRLLVENLQHLLRECRNRTITVTTEHVFGHTEVYGNDTADQYATLGVTKATKGIVTEFNEVTDVKEYNLWKLPKITPLILSGKRLYCREDRKLGVPTYEALTYADDNFLGTNKPCGYTVVRPPEFSESLEEIKDLVHSNLNGVYKPYIIHLDTVGASKFLRERHLFGLNCIRVISHRRSTVGLIGKDTPVFVEVNTNGIMTLVYEYMDELNLQLDLTGNTDQFTIIDITDLFYEKDKKDVYKILPDITSKVRCLNVQYDLDGKLVDLPIALGTDIADRNQLKRLEKLISKVEIVIKKFPIRLQYTTIITLLDGTRAIWSSINANNVFFKVIKKSRGKRFLLK